MNRPPLSKTELEIARVVWRLGTATMGQIFEEVSSERDDDYTTVQTYIRRLESKGYLESDRQGRAKIYRPKIEARRVIRETVDDFMERLFDGEPLPLMRHLIQDRGISETDVAELRALLDSMDDTGPTAPRGDSGEARS